MIDIKIGGPQGTRATDKTKSARKPGQTGGTSFADMLESAAAASPLDSLTATLPTAAYVPLESLPTAREQASLAMQSLDQLAQDALAGNPTNALEKLNQSLQQSASDRGNLTPEQQQALDELATRAAVEAAKRGQ